MSRARGSSVLDDRVVFGLIKFPGVLGGSSESMGSFSSNVHSLAQFAASS